MTRRKGAFELVPLCTSYTDSMGYNSAKSASEALRRGIEALGEPISIPPIERTFDEKLALVLAGKARVVPTFPIRKVDPDYTLGGVAW